MNLPHAGQLVASFNIDSDLLFTLYSHFMSRMKTTIKIIAGIGPSPNTGIDGTKLTPMAPAATDAINPSINMIRVKFILFLIWESR